MCLILSMACAGPLGRFTRPPSPHDAYAQTLRTSGLAATALGRDWLQVAARALDQPVDITLPFRESGYFAPDKPSAVVYRFAVQRGRTLAVDAAFESLGAGRLFVDVFRIDPGQTPDRLTLLPEDGTSATAAIEDDGIYLLRLQPELLRGGRYTVAQRTLASLPFPVTGLDARSIESGFGAERDAGVRRHEGVDIFAQAGTPVVAVSAGTAQPSTNALGGNVIWLRDATSRRTYYYANLERWAGSETTRVAPGDVVGYVGNTGNARTTAPHLHFGIYDGGAIDPLPFIAADQPTLSAPVLDLALGSLARVNSRRAALRRGPDTNTPTLATLERGTLVTVYGVAPSHGVRVLLPDDSVGYVSRPSLTAAEPPGSRRSLATGTVLRAQPIDASPAVHVIEAARTGDVLGSFNGYDLVRSDTVSGWVVGAGAR